MCLDVDLEEKIIVANECDDESPLQKFIWGTMSLSSLKSWTHFGAPILDEKELKDLAGN